MNGDIEHGCPCGSNMGRIWVVGGVGDVIVVVVMALFDNQRISVESSCASSRRRLRVRVRIRVRVRVSVGKPIDTHSPEIASGYCHAYTSSSGSSSSSSSSSSSRSGSSGIVLAQVDMFGIEQMRVVSNLVATTTAASPVLVVVVQVYEP
jgi:hypothetical protein